MSLRDTQAAFEAHAAERLRGERDAAFPHAARTAALEDFRSSGIALEKHEAWRFTDLRALERFGNQLASRDASAQRSLPELPDWTRAGALAEAARLVFVDDQLAPALSQTASLPDGVLFTPLGGGFAPLGEGAAAARSLGSIAAAKQRAWTALNTVLAEQTVGVIVPDSVTLDRPLLIVRLCNGGRAISSPRVWIELGRNASACVIELHTGAGAGDQLVNAVSEARLHAGAHLDHVLFQDHSLDTVHLAQLAVTQDRDSHLGSHSIALGAALARTEIHTTLTAEGAHARLHGLYLGAGSQVLDHHTTIDHAAPHTRSDELYKGILDGRARGVFCGRVEVRPDAQKIDAQQTNRALLISDSAGVHTRPQLEIYADDVRCSHGASIGQLDADALFYLRARGIDAAQARAMLTQAFVEDVLASLACPDLGARVRARLLEPDSGHTPNAGQ